MSAPTAEERIDLDYVLGLIGPDGELRPGWSGSWLAEHQRIIHQIYASLPDDLFRDAVRRARQRAQTWRPRVEKPKRWTEEEHASKHRLLTWEQQQNVWLHIDAGEAMLKGEMTVQEYRNWLANAEPGPTLRDVLAMFHVARAKARVHKMPPKPGTAAPPPEDRPAPLSKQQVEEVQARVDALQEMYPSATSGQILKMLRDGR